MSPHPAVRSRPAALWKTAPEPDPGDPAVLPYRPDVFARLGPEAVADPRLLAIAYRHPACALALLMAHPERTRAALEPALCGSGEAVYHYLTWAAGRGLSERADHRATLVRDGYWGFRHARRTGDVRLLAEVETWCGDEKRRYGAAAALHLMRHPHEAVAPYRELIAAHPFYAYLALPRLHPRGFEVQARDIGSDAKWAWHFALSRFTRDPREFEPAVFADPAWGLEYAAARGWLSNPRERERFAARLEAAAGGHPLWPAAARCLRARAASPSPLTEGIQAEARTLDALGRRKNRAVWRPSPEQIQSPAFRRIVGTPQYTARGHARGTIVDSAEQGLAEIKSGRSRLEPCYQLRLQAFRAVVEDQPLSIYTSRPIPDRFAHWLGPLGVKIEPLP